MTDIFENDLTNKRNFADAKEANGSVESTSIFEGENPDDLPVNLEVALTQQAYIEGNTNERPVYKANGIDSEGNEYEVTWEVVDNWEEIEDEQEMCDWDIPVSIEKI